MKKRLLSLLLSALLLANVTACNTVPEKEVESTIEDINTTTSTSEITTLTEPTTGDPLDDLKAPPFFKADPTKKMETIDCGNNYCLYRVVETFELCCNIYNADGEIVFSEKTPRPMMVSEIDPGLIEIRIGYGTGIIGHRYFSVDKNQISDEFLYVIASSGTQIAYLNGDINDRKLIIQDIYQSANDCKSFELDFSPDHTPVIDAKFSEDGSTLHITYMKGENYTTSQATFYFP